MTTPQPSGDGMIERGLQCAGLHWHIQEAGTDGPRLLLLHGTAASVHSWDPIRPLLAEHFRLLLVDLPGHGKTSRPKDKGLTIEGMSASLGDLLKHLGFTPDYVIGHSAGAAVLIQMTLDQHIKPQSIISLNGALLPFSSTANRIFGPMAKMLSATPFVASLVSRRMANRASVARLTHQLGSRIPDSQVDGYVKLMRSTKHISAALQMMANWDLPAFGKRFTRLETRIELISCNKDYAVPASQADQVASLLPNASAHRLMQLGHLAHEESPQTVFDLIFEIIETPGKSAA